MTALEALRTKITRVVLIAIWLNVPLLAVTGLVLGSPHWIGATIGAALLGAAAIWAETSRMTGAHYVHSVAMAAMPAMLVAVFEGHPWQIDMHMYFYAALAVLALFCDWRAIVVGAATVAVHHLVLNFVLPTLVFPEGADFGRVVLHAVIVVFQSAALTWLGIELEHGFLRSSEALREAEQAQRSAANSERARAEAESRAAEARRASTLKLAADLEQSVGAIVGSLGKAAEQARGSATHLRSMVGGLGQSAVQASSEADSANLNVQDVASATEELTSSIREINQQISRSDQLARAAVERATGTNATVEGLADAAHRIGEVVKLITDIASQTNLLALNATIEAARAGEAGKGFAVVANEVKSLANQTARATEEIASQVGAIQSVSNTTVRAIREIGDMINQVAETVSGIAAAAEEQGAATGEIARNAQSTMERTHMVKQSIAGVGSAADALLAIADGNTASADTMAHQTDTLRRQIGTFLSSLRA